jgi:hypothetical protein
LSKLYFNLPEDKIKYPPIEEVLTLIYGQIDDQRRIEHRAFNAEHFGHKDPNREPLFDSGIVSTFVISKEESNNSN